MPTCYLGMVNTRLSRWWSACERAQGHSMLRGRLGAACLSKKGSTVHLSSTVPPMITIIPGSSKKTAITQKVSACTGSPRVPYINVANHHFSMGGASLAVLFEGSAKRCFHTTSKLGDQGCLTVLTRVQIGWLFFFEEPGIIYISK